MFEEMAEGRTLFPDGSDPAFVAVGLRLDAVYEKVSGGLVNMMANTDRWCPPHLQVREDGAEYEVTEGLPHTPTLPHSHTPTLHFSS